MPEHLETERRAMNAAVNGYMFSPAVSLEEMGFRAHDIGAARSQCPYPEDFPLTSSGGNVFASDPRAAWLRGWDRAEDLRE